MATYLAHNSRRDTVTLMLSKAEAEALAEMAIAGWSGDSISGMNGQKRDAGKRAMDALSAATNTSARRAGYFE